ncbi:hypothetical protein N665_1976s0005 [Sinapis alba]|nr:hypothetical protein N665_1976s0005 [Sinapis alba]
MKGQKRKGLSTKGEVSTRDRKAVSDGNELVGEDVVHQKSTPLRETTVVLLSLDYESEDMSGVSSKFKSTEYTKTCKIQTKCYLSKTIDMIKKLKDDVKWFTSHPQFHHFFHMPDEQYMKLQEIEHALISSLDCQEYPRRYLKIESSKFVDYYFGGKKKITIKYMEHELLSMKTSNDRLKLAVLFFLGRVIRGKPKDSGPLDPFILRIVEDLRVCGTFLWGHSPCEDCPRMCKRRFKKSIMRGYPLEEIYDALGKAKEKIWWKELYEIDIVARVFPNKKDKKKVTFVEESFSNPGLELSLKGLEIRILASMGKGFSVFKLMDVEDSLDAESGKENSENDDEDEEQVDVEKWIESSEEEKENETGKSERRRIEVDATWRRIPSESDNDEEDEVAEDE